MGEFENVKVFENVNWTITRPLDTAKSYSKNMNIEDVMNQKVVLPKGCKIAILTIDKKVATYEPISGEHTVREVLTKLKTGLEKKIGPNGKNKLTWTKDFKYDSDRTEVIYRKISMYFSSSYRLKLVNTYEKGELKPADLFGDHIYLEGLFMKDNVLYMNLGS